MSTAKELMIKQIISVNSQDKLLDVVHVMKEMKIGAVLVNENNSLVGIFTERDLVTKFTDILNTSDIQSLQINDFITRDLTVATIDQPCTELIALMKSKHIRHMPVSDKDKIVGILSLRDLLSFSLIELGKMNEELKNTQIQIAHASKMAAMGEMGAGVAHELNQPLMAISTHLEGFLLNNLISNDQKLTEKLKKVRDQFNRLNTIVQRLSAYSKFRGEVINLEDINVPIQDSLFLFEQQLKDHNIKLELKLDKNIPNIFIDKYQIQDVAINLLVNSRDAIDDIFKQEAGGNIILFSKTIKNLDCVVVGLIDNGKPIDNGTEKKIFDRFFTTKGTEKGTGLGLAVCFDIIKNHKGILGFVNFAKNKKLFYFALPLTKSESLVGNSQIKEQIENNLKKKG